MIIARELINTIAMMTMIVPIDPYSTLYRPKLLTNTEKISEESMHRNVVMSVPGECNLHFFLTEGA